MYDYSELEKKVRTRIPAENYGSLGYFLSVDHPLYWNCDDKIKFAGHFSFDIGYDCFHAAQFLGEELEKMGRFGEFHRGRDAKGLFDNHSFCTDIDSVVLDATPLYDLVGERHRSHDHYMIRKGRIAPRGILAVDQEAIIFCNVHPSDIFDSLTVSLLLTDIASRDQVSYTFSAKPLSYREVGDRNYQGYGDKTEASSHLSWMFSKDLISVSDWKFDCKVFQKNRLKHILESYEYVLDSVVHKVGFAR